MHKRLKQSWEAVCWSCRSESHFHKTLPQRILNDNFPYDPGCLLLLCYSRQFHKCVQNSGQGLCLIPQILRWPEGQNSPSAKEETGLPLGFSRTDRELCVQPNLFLAGQNTMTPPHCSPSGHYVVSYFKFTIKGGGNLKESCSVKRLSKLGLNWDSGFLSHQKS